MLDLHCKVNFNIIQDLKPSLKFSSFTSLFFYGFTDSVIVLVVTIVFFTVTTVVINLFQLFYYSYRVKISIVAVKKTIVTILLFLLCQNLNYFYNQFFQFQLNLFYNLFYSAMLICMNMFLTTFIYFMSYQLDR